jgi:tetratricopeptide (TPR) repeat protein
VYDLAAAALKNVLRESPCNVAALLNVAEVYRARGMQYEAIKYLRGMVSLEPDCAETRRSLADLYCERGLTREAIEEYENCLRLCRESDWSGQVEQRMRALAEQGD